MKQTLKNLIEHPKTTLGGIVILAATVMLGFKVIDSTSWAIVAGLAATWIGVSAKDCSTSNDKNNGEQK